MNKRRFCQLVERYRCRLMLRHWNIVVDFDRRPTSDTSNAEIRWDWSYDNATIRLAAGWRDWEPAFAEGVVAHELVHALSRDLHVCVDDTFDSLPRSAQAVARAHFRHEVEGLTERLAVILTGQQPEGSP